jgi:hypothetical protein
MEFNTVEIQQSVLYTVGKKRKTMIKKFEENSSLLKKITSGAIKILRF